MPNGLQVRGVRVVPNAYLSLLKHTNHFLLVTFCDMPTGIGVCYYQVFDHDVFFILTNLRSGPDLFQICFTGPDTCFVFHAVVATSTM